MGRGPTPPSAPPPAELCEPVPDLRQLITPKKVDLRNSIIRKTPPAPRKLHKSKRNRSYTGPVAGREAEYDIRERQKTEEAREREREAEQVLAETRALREAAEEDEARVVNKKIAVLVSYKDALVSNSSQPHGSQHPLHSRKRGRTRTPSRSPSSSPAPSPCRSPRPEAERRRETARGGKGKERRRSYSRSPIPEHRRRAARTPERAIPGLAFREDRRRSLLKGR